MSKSEVDSCAVLDEPFLQDYVDQLEKSRKIIYKTLFSTDLKFQLNCDSLGFVHVWLIENNLKRNNTLEIVLPLKLKKSSNHGKLTKDLFTTCCFSKVNNMTF
jgi:hypothetical protein